MTRNGYQHMVLDHYVEKVRAVQEERRERLRGIRTRAQARAYQEQVRKAIARAFSPRPRKTALNTQVTGVLERPGYRIEKLTFESRPGCLVTGNLYVPEGLSGPAPGVIGACGHSEDGKACELYQGFCQRLVRNGFVVLIYEPFNQGERDQYYALSAREAVRGCCNAHNMMGKQLELVGEFFGMWRAWDGIRALDVLLERPEVDASRVGVTGNSGGGTLSEWLWAIEDRFTMAAPSCFVTTFLHNLENEIPADCEQYPPGVIGAGLELADLMIAGAPKPAMLLGQKHDFFDRRGLRTAYEELRRFYRVLGAEEDVDLFIGPQGHGYSAHNQEAMVGFFTRHAEIGKAIEVSETEALAEESLYATPKGNVVDAGARPIYTLIVEKADRLLAARKPLEPETLKRRVARLLNLSPQQEIPHYRVLRPVRAEGDMIARYAVETEGSIRTIVRKRLKTPAYAYSLDVEKVVHLYLPHVSAEEDMAEDMLAMALKQAHPLYALDVRGLGESMADESRGGFFQAYGMDYMFHGHGILFGESYLGRRVHDVLSVMDLLMHEGAEEIRVYGRGQGALLALFAGLLDDRVSQVTLKNGPLSYRAWTHAPLVAWPSANFLRGALKTFDLPDCIRAIEEKVRIIEPWGPDMKPLIGEALRREMEENGVLAAWMA